VGCGEWPGEQVPLPENLFVNFKVKNAEFYFGREIIFEDV